MADPPRDDSDELPEAEADARFERGIKNALAMPPKPHTKKGAGGPAPSKASVPGKG